jgi:hypothetical protein
MAESRGEMVPRLRRPRPVRSIARTTRKIARLLSVVWPTPPGRRWSGAPANAHVQIVQTPSHVLLHGETVNTGRIVPLGARQDKTGDLRFWRGDSVGSWHGDVLVIDSINFRTGAMLRGFGVGPGMGVRAGPDMRLIERLSLASADSLLYEFTVDNPKLFSRRLTARVTMTRTDVRLFEYACHEGYYGLENILRGARAEAKRR